MLQLHIYRSWKKDVILGEASSGRVKEMPDDHMNI